MADFHVSQFPLGWTGICPPRNCACASDAMGIAWAGGPQLTAAQVREASGVSCVKGDDTTSGGLRIADQIRVGKLYGVEFDFGGYQNWPATTLADRLKRGYGVIVLGDCNAAPVNPCSGEVYHSAFCHGYRVQNGVEQTHWHDPRNQEGVWVAISAVIRYWQNPSPSNPTGWRYAGFVAPNQVIAPPDTSTGGSSDMGVIATNPRRTTVRQVTGIADGAYRRCFNVKGELWPVPTDVREVFCLVDINPPFTAKGLGNEAVTFSGEMFQIGGNEVTYAYPRDVNLVSEDTGAVNEVAAYNEGVRAVKAAANAVPEKG